MPSYDYDVLVIGSGPGGEGASMKAVKAGKRVAMVERHDMIGGGCTHWGTIPSKTLRHAVHRLTMFQSDPLYAATIGEADVDFPRLLRSAASVIEKQVKMRRSFYERNDVEVIHGHACFMDPHTMVVDDGQGRVRSVSSEHIILATGSRPFRPKDIDFTHPRIREADTVLGLEHTPKSVTVYGAGVIGCEYTSIFRQLHSKVNLINSRDRLLSFLDEEIIDALAYHLRDMGVIIRHEEEYDHVEANDDGVVLHMKSGKKIRSEVLLFAAGRTANTDNLGLENAGIEPDARGRIKVGDAYTTSVDHIYAVGDVVGAPGLASAAYDQGRFAATHIIEGGCEERLVKFIPTGIYTSPEISSVGYTEKELTQQKIPYEMGHAFFRSLARAQITGQTVGMLKLLFHRETLEVLGIHCFGQNAAEIIHIGQAIMAQDGPANNINYFINTTFNYPTMAEAYRVAALNGVNRLF